MKLILFGASVFYLLGLKLTSQIHFKPDLLNKPAVIESKSAPANKIKENEKLIKPQMTTKDSTISAGKVNYLNPKTERKSTKIQSAGKGAV